MNTTVTTVIFRNFYQLRKEPYSTDCHSLAPPPALSNGRLAFGPSGIPSPGRLAGVGSPGASPRGSGSGTAVRGAGGDAASGPWSTGRGGAGAGGPGTRRQSGKGRAPLAFLGILQLREEDIL